MLKTQGFMYTRAGLHKRASWYTGLTFGELPARMVYTPAQSNVQFAGAPESATVVQSAQY